MKYLHDYIRQRRLRRIHVWLDSRDNSVTLSKYLWGHMCDTYSGTGEPAEVFVFYSKQDCAYGFMVEHGIKEPTQLCKIQYNERYRCVGFETLCPSVGTIFYDYGLPAECVRRLHVTLHNTNDNRTYYTIDRP